MFDFPTDLKLTNAEIIELNKCFAPVTREYNKGEIITICSPDDDTIGIIKSGIAYLLTTNSNEQRRIIDYYEKDNAFGKHFLPSTEDKLFYVVAKTKCTVDFIRYKKLITCCEKCCAKHIVVLNHIIMSTTKKSLIHIDILGQRTLKSKLMSFLEYLGAESNENTFTLPLPFSDLSDYLAVDRSALMREVKNLNAERVIATEKRKVQLL